MGERVAEKTADDLPAVSDQGQHRPVSSDDRSGSSCDPVIKADRVGASGVL
jgi:hypothetical protein